MITVERRFELGRCNTVCTDKLAFDSTLSVLSVLDFDDRDFAILIFLVL
eukprot:COSAG02_NODE_2979_length_7625_cov_73.716715_9_plen_49_part_00